MVAIISIESDPFGLMVLGDFYSNQPHTVKGYSPNHLGVGIISQVNALAFQIFILLSTSVSKRHIATFDHDGVQYPIALGSLHM